MIPSSIKGIGGCPYDHADMQDLNIATGTFNIILDQILYTDPGGGANPTNMRARPIRRRERQHDQTDRPRRKNLAAAGTHGLSHPAGAVNRGAAEGSWLDLVAHPENEYSAAFSMPNMLSKEAVKPMPRP